MQKPREHTHTFSSLPIPPLSDAKGNTLSMPGRPAPCMPGPCTPSVSAGMACFCHCARVGAHRKRVRAHGGISPRIGVGRREIRDKGHLAVSTPPSLRARLRRGWNFAAEIPGRGEETGKSLRATVDRPGVAAVGDEHDRRVCGPEFEQQQCGRFGLAARQHHRRKEHPSPVPRIRLRAGLYYCRITADCGTWGVPMSWRICTCPQGCACGTHVHTLRPLCRVLTRVAPCGGDQNDPRMVCESVVVRNGDSLRLLSARLCSLSVFHARSLFLFSVSAPSFSFCTS